VPFGWKTEQLIAKQASRPRKWPAGQDFPGGPDEEPPRFAMLRLVGVARLVQVLSLPLTQTGGTRSRVDALDWNQSGRLGNSNSPRKESSDQLCCPTPGSPTVMDWLPDPSACPLAR